MPPVSAQSLGAPANIGSGPVPVKKSNAGLVSLILGIFGICGITAIVGLVFGFIALSNANKNEGQGKTLAIVALVLNALWLVLLLVFGVFGDS